MNRRGFVLSSLVVIAAGTARAQSLPVASPSPKPFALFNEHGALSDQLTLWCMNRLAAASVNRAGD